MSLAQEIKQKAIELDFDLAGVTDTSPIDPEQVEFLTTWLRSGFAGRMDYMHKNLQKRIEPAQLLENAQSVIVVGLNYTPSKQKPKPPDATNPTGKVANYAQYEDYHPFIKKRLRKLIKFINSATNQHYEFRICVDSAPLAERALAVRAGIGFIGKNHILINPKLGCQIFLGEVITNLKLEPDEPTEVNCSNCNECIGACPTGALRTDGQFDANKCINYLTIEYKGQIPLELSKKIDTRLFGCDECILACPYQKDAPTCKNKQFKFYNDRASINLQEVLSLSADSFEAQFTDSPIKRLGLEGLKRNARICLANMTDVSA
jgi:epoxyqueuosine reductase